MSTEQRPRIGSDQQAARQTGLRGSGLTQERTTSFTGSDRISSGNKGEHARFPFNSTRAPRTEITHTPSFPKLPRRRLSRKTIAMAATLAIAFTGAGIVGIHSDAQQRRADQKIEQLEKDRRQKEIDDQLRIIRESPDLVAPDAPRSGHNKT